MPKRCGERFGGIGGVKSELGAFPSIASRFIAEYRRMSVASAQETRVERELSTPSHAGAAHARATRAPAGQLQRENAAQCEWSRDADAHDARFHSQLGKARSEPRSGARRAQRNHAKVRLRHLPLSHLGADLVSRVQVAHCPS